MQQRLQRTKKESRNSLIFYNQELIFYKLILLLILIIIKSKKIKIMEKQSSDVSAKVLLQIKDVPMHRFINNKKSLFTSGNCKIAKIDHNNGSTVYFINMNSFYYTLRRQIVFVKMVYQHSISYLFPHFENGLSTLSLPKDSPSIHNLEQILSNAAVLTDFTTAMNDPSLRNKIETHCKNIQKESVYNPDSVKQAITTTGRLLNVAFTTIGDYMKTGVNYVGQFINNKIDQGEGGQVKPQTRQKWQNIKKGTNNILKLSLDTYNSYVDPYVKPVVQKGMQQFNTLKQKIQTSQNQNVKYARQLAETSQKALGTAFQGLVKGGKQVGGELNAQTKKIVQKKYGDDYVKTFIQGEDKQKLNNQRTQTGATTEDRVQYPTLQQTEKK